MTAETFLAPRAPGRHKHAWLLTNETFADNAQAAIEELIQQPYGTSHRKERTRA